MNIEEFLTLAAEKEASDLFIIAGLPLTMKTNDATGYGRNDP